MKSGNVLGLSGGTTKQECSGIRVPYRAIFAASLAFLAGGCGSNSGSKGGPGQTSNPAQVYLAAGVGSSASGVEALSTFTLDSTAGTFVITSFAPSGVTISTVAGSTVSSGATILESGKTSTLSNGVVRLDATYFPGAVRSSASPSSQTRSSAVEIPNQAALAEVEASNSYGTFTTFTPLVPTQFCPSLQSPQSFQFVTIPRNSSNNGWNPNTDTAYGSVSVSTSGSAVKFSNITQYTLPATNGGTPGTPTNPASGSAATTCSATLFGETMSIPNADTVQDPGGTSQSSSPSATVGISPSGFLLEDSGSGQGGSSYDNVLGAGYGAIGLQQPSSALNTSTVVAAHYQGILYGAHDGSIGSIGGPGFRLIGSFGDPTQTAANCPHDLTTSVPNGASVIYGGEFANNDPSSNAYGNCDLAIDLGTQNATTNGLYDKATIYVSASFLPYNSSMQPYHFAAVAIAGQIAGKYAIFLIGLDTAGNPQQPWGIYLLQSN